MKFSRISLITAVAACILSSCAPAAVKNVTNSKQSLLDVKSEPAQLAVIDGKVDAKLTLSFPKGYFKKNATLVVTPNLVYEGGKRIGASEIFQGTNVKSNYKVVPVEGAVHTMDVSFDYIKGIEKSYLELECVMTLGQKSYTLPAIRVAEGCNVTANLVEISGACSYKADGYEQITHHESETTIHYAVNSAYVKNNAANREAINTYRQQIADFTADERYTVTGTEVLAYASPEGGEELNANLSDQRAKTAVKALARSAKAAKPQGINQIGLGQDWEGFKAAVEQSDIKDKNLILRLLEMYADPAEREAEMRNLSEIFEELKTDVFPALRRATYVVRADKLGLDDRQIAEAAATALETLDEKEILRAAALATNLDTKEAYYHAAAQRFQSEAAYFNLAVVALEKGNNLVAKANLDAAPLTDPDVQNARGVLALRNGDYEKAMECFKAAGTEDAKYNICAILIRKGEYAQAAQVLQGTGTFNEALADLLAGKVDEAWDELNPKTAREEYLKAVIAARKGDSQNVSKYIKLASSDPELKERAAKDVEFANYR